MDWKCFWQKYRLIEVQSDKNLLFQVGKTVRSEVIDKNQFNILINEIENLLSLTKKDNLLDLCCGNGILTYELSKKVNYVIGIDFSEHYIQIANKYKIEKNVEYFLYDINKLDGINNLLNKRKINKILTYDALAYFTKKEFHVLLQNVLKITENKFKFLLGSVLDENKKWNFFNTLPRKSNYFIKIKLMGKTKGLGKWWSKEDIFKICKNNNLNCIFFDQNDSLYTAHYRMNVLIEN